MLITVGGMLIQFFKSATSSLLTFDNVNLDV